jgi:hypothetical protein
MSLMKCVGPRSNDAPLKKTTHPKQRSLDVSNTEWTTSVARWVLVSSDRLVEDIKEKVSMKKIL